MQQTQLSTGLKRVSNEGNKEERAPGISAVPETNHGVVRCEYVCHENASLHRQMILCDAMLSALQAINSSLQHFTESNNKPSPPAKRYVVFKKCVNKA